jgi:hypothetical protein
MDCQLLTHFGDSEESRIRHRDADLTEADSKRLHPLLVENVEKSGKFWISTTELKGRSWFRINPVNFRTRTDHMDQLLTLLEEECRSTLHSAHAAKQLNAFEGGSLSNGRKCGTEHLNVVLRILST